MAKQPYNGPSKEGLLKFDSAIEAREYSAQIAKGYGCSGNTKYWFPVQETEEETTLSKDEYAELADIPKELQRGETGLPESNPRYEELPAQVTVKKAVLINSDEVRRQYTPKSSTI